MSATEQTSVDPLRALADAYPIGDLKLYNEQGRRWRMRMEAADACFRDYSYDWRENQELLTGFRALSDKYRTYVSLGYAIQQAYVADTYYANPDPYVQDLSGDKDLGRILSDVFRGLHKKAESDRYMKEAMQDQWWAGFGLLWPDYAQRSYEVPTDIGEDGEPTATRIVAIDQRPIVRRISPWRARFDPDGKDWSLSDHKWIAVQFWMTLDQALADRRFSNEDKARLVSWWRSGEFQQKYNVQQVGYNYMYGGREQDPRYMRLPFAEIWARPEKKIYYQPSGAQFVMGDGAEVPNEWPKEFADEDALPAIYIARNRESEDESGSVGFIGVPDIRLIKPQLYNIQRLDSLFIKANRHVINKYLTRKGALDQQAQKDLEDSDRNYQVLEVDDDAFTAPGVSAGKEVKFQDILYLVPQAEMKELRHLEGIRHNIQMIWQIIGQGPGDRGGQAPATTATESLGVQRGLERRLTYARALGRYYFVELTKRFYLMIKARQTLPIWYQRQAKGKDTGVWAKFQAEGWADLDLNFDCGVGESEPRTREEEVGLRRQAAEVLLPIFTNLQDSRRVLAIAEMLTDPLRIIGLENLYDHELEDIAEQLYRIDADLADGKASGDDVALGAKKQELVAALVNKLLTDAHIQRIEGGAPTGGGQASLPAAQSPGEASFEAGARGSAAAGRVGGMIQ